MKAIILCMSIVLLSGCSVVGKETVENAPYKIIQKSDDEAIELRRYDRIILVSAPMKEGMDKSRNSAFRQLFDYISGDNIDQSKIAMTAPVLMDNATEASGTKIPMTAPVFIDDKSEGAMMSFVMPTSFTMETTPLPTNPDIKISELIDYIVATIRFSGFLKQGNIDKHKEILQKWITDNGYTAIGPHKTAGYNPPFTIPALRRNEILIPVAAP